MSVRIRRLVVLVVVGALTWSLALGAATPVAAGGLLGGDDHSLESVLAHEAAVDGTADELENASRNGSALANATSLNGTWVNGSWVNGTGLKDTVRNGSADDGTALGDPVATPEATPAENEADERAGPDVVDDTTETVEAVGESSSGTADRTTNATGDVVDETVNATGAGVEQAANATGAGVDEAADATTGAVNESGISGDGAATDAGERVAETADSAGDSDAGTTNSTTELLEESARGATTTVEETTGATDGTADLEPVLNRAVNATTGPVDDVTATGTGAEFQPVVDVTVDLLQRTTETLTGVVERTVEDSAWLLEDAVAGPFGGSEEAVTGEAYGLPAVDGGSSLVGPGGAWSDAGSTETAGGRVTLVDGAESGADGSDTGGADEDGAGVEGDGSPGGLDPLGSGAAVGAALLVGSLVASRAGMAGSTMGAGATTLPRALFAALREYVTRLAVLAGYSRYDFDDPLENENRAAVLETVESSPGINLTSLVEATSLSQSTVRYHLQVLEHEGLLEGAKVRGRRRYVPRTDDDVELLAAFEEESTQAVLAALFEHEPATGTTLAEALDRDPSTVSHHLSRLSEAGLVEREQDGPALRNSLTPKVREALSEVEVTASVQAHAQADD